MSKLGSYSYPDVKIGRAVDLAAQIARDYRGSISTSGLATALNMAERGGGFLKLKAALKDYGLAEGRGQVRITPSGEAIVFGEGFEQEQARAEAFFRVQLFREMWDRMGSEVPAESRLRAVLQDITGQNLAAISPRTAAIRTLYLDGVQFVGGGPRKEPDGEPIAPASSAPMGSEGRRPPSNKFVELRFGETQVRVSRTIGDIDMVMKVLEVVKQELERETQPAP